MMYSWKGYGLIVPLLLIAGTYSLVKLFSSVANMTTRISISLFLALIGISLWYLGHRFMQNDSVIEVKTSRGNQKIKRKKFDVFCSIPVKHWGIAAILLSFIIAMFDLFN